MTKKDERDLGYESHWFVKSLKFKFPRLPKRRRQKKSLPGQLSLPGMAGEAERNLPAKKRNQ